jgi:mannose-6-phosphate isomerase-like protein (cupin superfamily)
MEIFRMRSAIPTYTAPDGAHIQEIAGRSTDLTQHSLAVIVHPTGTASTDHHHTLAEEVYLVRSGHGRVRVDGITRGVDPGDAIIIRPGQHHKLWNDGPDDLVLIVSCAPAYEVNEVIWDE